MRDFSRRNPIAFVLAFYLVCFAFRAVEYFLFRTDQTAIGEAFVHKLIGIALLIAVLPVLRLSFAESGFRVDDAIRGKLIGLALGLAVFAVAYGTEIVLLKASGQSPALRFYVTSYAIQGNRAMEGGMAFILICLVGNLINVVMEEGIFRGLCVRVLDDGYSFALAVVLSSLLFGLWHIAQPIRNFLDGEQSAMGAMMSALMLVATSALLGVQYCLLARLTGSLWAGMAAHFVNNASANLIHVVTAEGADSMQVLRIAIAQALSFVVVLAFYLAMRRDHRRRNR